MFLLHFLSFFAADAQMSCFNFAIPSGENRGNLHMINVSPRYDRYDN